MLSSLALFLSIIATLIGAGGALYFKLAADTITLSLSAILKNKALWLAIFLYSLSSVFSLIALRMADLSVIYPLTSLTYIWIAFLSVKVLKEHMNFSKWFGISLILLGVIIISFGM